MSTPPQPWHRHPTLGLALICVASVLTVVVAALPANAASVPLAASGSWLPPWTMTTSVVNTDGTTTPTIPDGVALGALWLAVTLGAVALVICLRALAAGWRPSPWRLLAFGSALAVATMVVPPVTSADVCMYAAYGRIQVLGMDPYTITPAEIFRIQFDPVLSAVERPWHDTPSVYGPLASWSQWLANVLGGESMHDIVFWLQVFHTTAFIGTGAVVVWRVRHDAAWAPRAALLTVANPLLLWAVIAGAHNEAIAVFWGVLALALMRRGPFAAGVAIGLAGCVKVSLVFYGLAMVWAYRRRPADLARLVGGALLPLVLAYGLWQPQALLAAARNTGYVSSGGWAALVWNAFGDDAPDVTRAVISAVALALLIIVTAILRRYVPAHGIGVPDSGARTDPQSVAIRTAVILSFAWLLTSPYTLAWYDLMVWAPLAWLGWRRADYLLIWRGVWLSLAFVAGRAIAFEPDVWFAARQVFTLSSVAQVGALAYVLWRGWQHWQRRRRSLDSAP